jgi:hypothetical protein
MNDHHVSHARKIGHGAFVPTMHSRGASMTRRTFGRLTRRDRSEVDDLAVAVDTIDPDA